MLAATKNCQLPRASEVTYLRKESTTDILLDQHNPSHILNLILTPSCKRGHRISPKLFFLTWGACSSGYVYIRAPASPDEGTMWKRGERKILRDTVASLL